jgi:hypothetical protein
MTILAQYPPFSHPACINLGLGFNNGMTPKCIPTLGVIVVHESQMFKALVERVNKHQMGPLGYHWKALEM